jgi:hypothetical protein
MIKSPGRGIFPTYGGIERASPPPAEPAARWSVARGKKMSGASNNIKSRR